MAPLKTSGRWPVGPFSAGVLVAMASLLWSGCATAYKMEVDALTSPKPAPTASYKIVTHDPSVETDSLRYKEVKDAVEVALSAKGMYEAPNGTDADVVIDLDYGINPPKIVYEIQHKPIFKTVPGEWHVDSVEAGPNGDRPVSKRDPDTQEYVGSEERVVRVISYEKYLRLSARENTPAAVEGRPSREIWAVDVTSEGQDNNLRKYIPIMAAASIDYIGQETDAQKSIKLRDTDADIAFIKKGLPAGGTETAGPSPARLPDPDKAGRTPALPFATSSKS